MINEQFWMILASVLSGLAGLIPLVLFVLGIAASRGKSQALRTFVPVEAVVVSQQMIERNNADSTDYRPDIEYEYAVELTCFGCSIGFAWATGVLWALIGGLGLCGVFIAAWFRSQARQAKRDEDKN